MPTDDNLILYDWLSFTAKHHSAESIVDLLGMELALFNSVKGARGYRERLYYDGISIHFEGREEVWCELSGKGCRAFETYGHGAWDTIFEELLSTREYHITRLDVAFDDHTGLLDLNQLVEDTIDKRNLVSKFEAWDCRISNKGKTIYHGSEKSDLRFRIYDKAKERKNFEDHWIRFELQMRDKKAEYFLAKLALGTIGETFIGVVSNQIRYVEDSGDTNKARWPMKEYWSAFIGAAQRISLYESPGTEYNLEKLENFVVRQAGAAAAAYLEIVGVEAYLDQVNNRLLMASDPKYDDLIRKCKEEV